MPSQQCPDEDAGAGDDANPADVEPVFVHNAPEAITSWTVPGASWGGKGRPRGRFWEVVRAA